MNTVKTATGLTGFSTALALAGFLAAPLLSTADTVKLKDGTVLNGVVKEDLSTADTLFFVVKKGGISDEKKIPRSQIAELVILPPDEVEFLAWGDLKDTKDRLGVVDYETIIRDKFTSFLAKYPKSKRAPEVSTLQKQYADEMAKVKEGWLQLDNRWIDPKELEWNKYVIDARILAQDLEVAFKSVKIGDASRHGLDKAYERYNKISTDFRGTPAYAQALQSYADFLARTKKELEVAIADQPALSRKRDSDRTGQTAAELEKTQIQMKADEQLLKDVNTNLKATKVPLKACDMLNAKSLEEAMKELNAEITKQLVPLSVTEIGNVAAATKAIAEAIEDQSKGNAILAYTKMDKGMTSMQKLFGSDTKLKAMRDKMKQASDAASRTTSAIMNGNVPTGTGTGTGTSAEAPAAPPKVGGAPKAGNLSGAAAAPDKPSSSGSTTGTAAGTTPKLQKKISSPPEEGGMGPILGIGAGVIAVLGLLMATMGKKKKKNRDDD